MSMPARSGADLNAVRGGIIGRARFVCLGVRLPGVNAPLPDPVFLKLFLAVVPLRLGEDDELSLRGSGSKRIVFVDTFLV